MMQFNNYLWGIYKKSKGYKKSCEYLENFKTIDTYLIYLKHSISNEDIDSDDINNIKKTYDFFENKHFTKDDAINIFTSWIQDGIQLTEEDESDYFPKEDDSLVWCDYISDWVFSDILFILHPDFFFIYDFNSSYTNLNFQTFVDICELFAIPLPKIPLKKDKLDRALYYINICESLLEFRQRYNLTDVDMYAFIYDYAYNILFDGIVTNTDNEVLPAPTKAWFIVDRFYDQYQEMTKKIENIETQISFEVSKNAKEGDILILYCPKPYSGLHSIWRLKKSSFIDPLFYNYRHGYICKPFSIPLIPLKEMKGNTILSKNVSVHVSFGTDIELPLSFDEYNEILRILKDEKNFDISLLPKIESIESLDTNIILSDERDVEEYLIEPFLKKIGYDSEKDYIRQMPLRMGTGVRYYPDYAFFANTQKGDETAKCILEAKYHILNDKQLENAFYQAKSYALRLNAYVLILCACEGIWIFQNDKNNNFSVKNYVHYTWNEVSNTDNFHTIISLLPR